MITEYPSETIEKVETTWTTDVDPGTATGLWAFPEIGADPTTFTAGTWKAAATESGGVWTRTSISPSFGATGATVLLVQGKVYDIYAKLDGTEKPVRHVGCIKIT